VISVGSGTYVFEVPYASPAPAGRKAGRVG